MRRLATLVDLRYVEQERPQGLAQALCCARQLVGHEPFAVLLPDVIILSEQPVTRQLMCMNERYGGSFIAIREVAACDVERHGIVELDGSVPAESPKGARITRLVEKPARHSARSALGIFGRYVLEPSIWNAIAQTKLDGRGEVQLTDALNLFCQRESLAGVCFQGRHYDAGDPLGYLKVNIELSLESAELRPLLLKYLSGIVDNGDRNAREVLPENADVKKGGNPPT